MREYNSYCGNYEYDGTNLVTRVDASASKDRVGGEQKRFVHFVGEHMVLTQKPRLWQGVMQHRELHWERVARRAGELAQNPNRRPDCRRGFSAAPHRPPSRRAG